MLGITCAIKSNVHVYIYILASHKQQKITFQYNLNFSITVKDDTEVGQSKIIVNSLDISKVSYLFMAIPR